MPAISQTKYVVNAGWNDVPHLDPDTTAKMLAATPAHLRAARSRGEPGLGSGAIYPIDPDVLRVDPFPIPAHWRRAFGMDFGWICTAAIWGALDDDTDTLYLYSEHYRGEVTVPVHASAIKSRGAWIPGVGDPAGNQQNQRDGLRTIAQYREEGLDIALADNAVETGIQECLQRMESGRLKVFSTLTNWFNEHRIYARDEKGAVVKKRDHAMDAMRYLVMSGLKRAIIRPVNDRLSATNIIADQLGGY